MRTLASACFAVSALVLSAGALSAAWTGSRLVDREGFIDLAGPLGGDTAFQQALTAALAGEVSTGSGLPAAVRSFLRPVIDDAASSVTRMAGYPRAWEETLRISHRLIFAAAPSNRDGADPTVVSLDLGPVAGLVTKEVGRKLGIEVPVPRNTTVEIGRLDNGGVLSVVGRTARLWPVLASGAGACGALALLLARKRSTTLALLGLGGAGLGVLGRSGAGLIPGAAAGAAGRSAVAQVFARGFAGRVSADLAGASRPVITGGLVVLALGTALRLTVGRRSMR